MFLFVFDKSGERCRLADAGLRMLVGRVYYIQAGGAGYHAAEFHEREALAEYEHAYDHDDDGTGNVCDKRAYAYVPACAEQQYQRQVGENYAYTESV